VLNKIISVPNLPKPMPVSRSRVQKKVKGIKYTAHTLQVYAGMPVHKGIQAL